MTLHNCHLDSEYVSGVQNNVKNTQTNLQSKLDCVKYNKFLLAIDGIQPWALIKILINVIQKLVEITIPFPPKTEFRSPIPKAGKIHSPNKAGTSFASVSYKSMML